MNWLRQTLAFTETEYLSLGGNMSTNSLKISDTTETIFLDHISVQSHQEIWQKYCGAGLCNVLDTLTYSLFISVPTHGHLSNPVFCSLYFKKKNDFRGSSSFSKYSKFDVDFGNAEKSSADFFDFQKIGFELVALNTRFDWERMLVIGCQYVNKLSEDLRYYWNRVFRADFFFRVIKRYDENSSVQI